MLTTKYVTQPMGGIRYLDLFETALEMAEFTHLDVAAAYATSGGVYSLTSVFKRIDRGAWERMHKRWLIGVDWCRTDPAALRELADLPNSTVRIHQGRTVVARSGCVPAVSFHPKAFLLRGVGVRAAVVGSGNLSRNGLTRGHECGSLLLCCAPIAPVEGPMHNQLLHLDRWFANAWKGANALSGLLGNYVRQYESREHMTRPTVTEDDAVPTRHLETTSVSRRAIRPDQLIKLRVATHLWIESGNLHKNRGPDRPGNQLMMSAMTRVFFGFDADDVAKDTSLGNVAIEYSGRTRPDCSLRFSNNSMDVLTLPVSGDGGPESYDQQVLLFSRLGYRSFRLAIGTRTEGRGWRRRSERISADFKMTSGRQWGVF